MAKREVVIPAYVGREGVLGGEDTPQSTYFTVRGQSYFSRLPNY
jgi:hypothetical protein